MKRWMMGAALALTLGSNAVAQEADISEIVVTASRIANPDRGGDTPGVFITRRADNLLIPIEIVCDTRDPARRQEEMRQTLRNLIRGQRAPVIALALGGDRVGVFDERAIDDVIAPGPRPDTSRATLLVKTRIGADDTVDVAVQRIRDYAARTDKVGRTEVTVSDTIQLSIIGLPRYRPGIIAAVAADAKAIGSALGEGYGVTLKGLEGPVDWRQSGPLEARLFIPYELKVHPLER